MFTKEFLDKLTARLERLEAESSVELIIAVKAYSGDYRDIDNQNGFICSIIALLVAVYSPWNFWPEALATLLFAAYFLGKYASSKIPWFRYTFTSKGRQREQARTAAQSVFVEKRLSSTRARTGLLLYLSYYEKLGVLLPDIGIEAVMPRAIFNNIEASWQKATSRQEFESKVLEALDQLVEPLKSALPHEADDENELPNEIYLVGKV